MINLLAILWITDPALGSFLAGNTQAVQAHTSLDRARHGFNRGNQPELKSCDPAQAKPDPFCPS